MGTFAWIAAIVGGSLLAVVVLGLFWLRRRPPKVEPLPTEWALTPRPVFSTEERKVHKLLREALPQHIVLAKLPLVRFCQPIDPVDVRYWFDLLGATHVAFAVCSPNGRVLAAIDLENDRASSRRMLQIKQSVLGACRVRYLRCAIDNLPSAGELQLLIPASTAKPPTPPAGGLDEARDTLSSTVASRRAQRSALWQDSATFQDSFFAPDSRMDGFGQSEFGGLSQEVASRIGAALGPTRFRNGDEVGGVVVDSPPQASRH